jgi:hypothetical protein
MGRGPGHAVQALAYLAYPPRQPVCGGAGPLVRLPGRIAGYPRLGPFLSGAIKGGLGGGEPVAGRVERRLGTLHRGLGLGHCVLSRSQPAAQAGELPDCLTARTGRLHHLTIIAGSRGPIEPPTKGSDIVRLALKGASDRKPLTASVYA